MGGLIGTWSIPGTLPGNVELVGSGRGLSGKLSCLRSFQWSGIDERVILREICQRHHIEESRAGLEGRAAIPKDIDSQEGLAT